MERNEVRDHWQGTMLYVEGFTNNWTMLLKMETHCCWLKALASLRYMRKQCWKEIFFSRLRRMDYGTETAELKHNKHMFSNVSVLVVCRR